MASLDSTAATDLIVFLNNKPGANCDNSEKLSINISTTFSTWEENSENFTYSSSSFI